MRWSLVFVLVILGLIITCGCIDFADSETSYVPQTIMTPMTLIMPIPPESVLHKDPILKKFPYTLRGVRDTISVTLYGGTVGMIESKDIPTACFRYSSDTQPCDYDEVHDYYKELINEEYQQEAISDLIKSIKMKTGDSDDQVRIAISLVQNIPYKGTNEAVYPYNTLYYNTGACQDKSLLLSALLLRLGYGTEILVFEGESHMAVGVSTSSKLYGFHSRDFAFVETTTPSIITDSNGFYGEGIRLTSNPIEYVISDGVAMTTLSEEYHDAKSFNDISGMDPVLPTYYYDEWYSLVTKYGMDVDAPYAQYGTKGSENIYNYYNYVNSVSNGGNEGCILSQNGVCVS